MCGNMPRLTLQHYVVAITFSFPDLSAEHCNLRACPHGDTQKSESELTKCEFKALNRIKLLCRHSHSEFVTLSQFSLIPFEINFPEYPCIAKLAALHRPIGLYFNSLKPHLQYNIMT